MVTPIETPNDGHQSLDDYVPGVGYPGVGYGPSADVPPAVDEPLAAVRPPVANAVRPDAAPAVLVLGVRQPTSLGRGSLPWLANVLGLDVYGRATLSDAARVEMNAAALLLLVIFVFDAIA